MSGRAPGMTAAHLDQITEVTVSLTDAGRALGLGRTKVHELALAGKFPFGGGDPLEVLRLGRRYRVKTADLRRFLGHTTTPHPSS